MSAAGYLSPSELTPVQGGMQLGNVTAKWWALFEAELRTASHIEPELTRPDGGYRTAARQKIVNPIVSARYSDHCKGKGIDLFNQRAFRDWDEERFLAIAKRNGFEFYVDREPWHARCVKLFSPPSIPKSLTRKDELMRAAYCDVKDKTGHKIRTRFQFSDAHGWRVINDGQAAALNKLGGYLTSVKLTSGQRDTLKALYGAWR